jgi:hypothetical protein
MIKKAKRYFNTSGPNRPEEHYTLQRQTLINKGIHMVKSERYFTIWAPRQTGKSTYFRLLAKQLESIGYEVLHTNVENFKNESEGDFLEFLSGEFKNGYDLLLKSRSFGLFLSEVRQIKNRKLVLIIDEIEGLNQAILGQFLHTIRNLYHFRDEHAVKSVILVGVSNITGVVEDHSSPFNIADSLEVPYFTPEETAELLHMHEEETDQQFDSKVKETISNITGNQPGLVNGLAYQLVERNPKKSIIDYEDYLQVENWFLNIAVDKNISNIINKSKQYRMFVEGLLFNEKPVKFTINDEKIKYLTSYGVIKNDSEGFVVFNVPLYKKALIDAFYPYSNGESDRFFRDVEFQSLFSNVGKLNFDSLIQNYKSYVKKRSFKYFREKDEETGKFKNLKEAALAYSFETYIQSFLQEVGGKSYLEPHTGLGRSDLIVNLRGHEYVIEFKIYRNPARFEKGKKQIAHYSSSLGIHEGIYLVFVPNTVKLPNIKEETTTINKVLIRTYIILYDEDKDF